MGGTFDEASFRGSSAEYGLRVWNGGGEPGGACTLLGPEGPEAGTVVSVTELSGPFLHAGCGRLRGGYRPYFENYTVDASIFEMILRGRLVIDDLKDH